MSGAVPASPHPTWMLPRFLPLPWSRSRHPSLRDSCQATAQHVGICHPLHHRRSRYNRAMSDSVSKLSAIAALIRLDRPIGSLLLLWPTLWALWLAGEGAPAPRMVIVFVAGVFVMRSFGCAINDFWDRDIDPHVERTRTRPLASGALGRREAVAVMGVLLAIALALALSLPRAVLPWTVPAVLITVTYPLLKRFTHLPQLYLGLAFSWSIPMAFAAHGAGVSAAGWLLMLANAVWVVAYDTVYAMSDRIDDLKVGVKSTAILFGEWDVKIMVFLQATTLALLAAVGTLAGWGMPYFVILVAAAGFFVWQFVLYRGRDRADCFRAFLNNAWFGAAVFLGVLLGSQA
ncbi:unnamed protein product [Cyprideis torosa]|uniref:4-hydroxybenzoate polyprenyltransferase, mitochondrial n=1 Tax=Cyprideis torosa TaxID=163714 RepID=A0A7R8WSB4_9CRUS|nr:unnamed protein product [Cyprideis torosa]CAG0908925.1 unnamed protein product [Cyprideis torosa]